MGRGLILHVYKKCNIIIYNYVISYHSFPSLTAEQSNAKRDRLTPRTVT
jgi:hypothetical protein